MANSLPSALKKALGKDGFAVTFFAECNVGFAKCFGHSANLGNPVVVADVLGRRGTLVLANVSLMAGALAMALGGSFSALMFARCVTSGGFGFSNVVTSVYNAEISPPSKRGFLSSFLDVYMSQP